MYEERGRKNRREFNFKYFIIEISTAIIMNREAGRKNSEDDRRRGG